MIQLLKKYLKVNIKAIKPFNINNKSNQLILKAITINLLYWKIFRNLIIIIIMNIQLFLKDYNLNDFKCNKLYIYINEL